MQDVSNGNLFCNVKEVLDRNVNIPPHPPWRSFDNKCNMCLFRTVREALDTNVNIPPHPPPDDHTTTYATCASSMCNTLKNRKFQILYPHFGKPHFWNLQPFHGIWMAHLKIDNPSKGAVSAACQKQQFCVLHYIRNFAHKGNFEYIQSSLSTWWVCSYHYKWKAIQTLTCFGL